MNEVRTDGAKPPWLAQNPFGAAGADTCLPDHPEGRPRVDNCMKTDTFWEQGLPGNAVALAQRGSATPCVKVHSSAHHTNINLRARASICAFGGEYIACCQRTTDTLERKLANGFDANGVFDHHQNGRANQNLTRLGFVTS